MSEIDVQNSRQIRDPMDVLITMEVPDEGITLTYSGYSSAKVADGSLGNAWPMRLLADLKGDGFPLDGSRVVYNSATSASETNGKIGVRSNIGQTVSVTVTGSATIVSLSIFATGATSVTYNGTTSAIVGGQVIIPVGATSITLTFNPASTTDRIEISQIVAGTSLRITNDTLIKAVVSLRSDLSIIDPTLPESELNIEVYNDADISEIVASLPEDTPITYQAGYEGDMSPLRKFYVAGQVTWADNVLSIHAVDAVHFLDGEIKTPLEFSSMGYMYYFVDKFLRLRGVSPQFERITGDAWATNPFYTIPNMNLRDFIAKLMSLFHLQVEGTSPIWINYIDAGIPSLTYSKPAVGYSIEEDSCGDIKKAIDSTVTGLLVQYSQPDISSRDMQFGTATWTKDVGVSISYDSNAHGDIGAIGILANTSEGEAAYHKLQDYYDGNIYKSWGIVVPCVPANRIGDNSAWAGSYGYADILTVNDASPNDYGSYNEGNYSNTYSLFSGFIPWDAYYRPENWENFLSQSEAWSEFVAAGVIGSDETSVELVVAGLGTRFSQANFLTRGASDAAPTFEVPIVGKVNYGSNHINLYPTPAIESLLERSPITYSFTWKGDPRMQPRDVVEWQRLDGTTETITLENITLTHEKGGTVAEITARKGIV